MQRWKITIEYDGTNFFGWQRQEDLKTVQETIEKAILAFSQENQEIYGSGRTDAKVHALGQVAHFDLEREMEAFKICDALNHFLEKDKISIIKAEKVHSEFHSRYDAKKRHYVYKILNRRSPLALEKDKAWHYIKKLDIKKMQDCANTLLGNHDFSTFRASNCQSNSPIKTIDKISFRQDGDFIFMDISAPSFMYHQVRNIIGTLTLVGDNSWTKKDFEKAFKAKDRTKGGITAPACGLYFKKIDF